MRFSAVIVPCNVINKSKMPLLERSELLDMMVI